MEEIVTVSASLGCSTEEFVKSLPELHHYTSLAGLQGILESGALWATHFSGTNDSMELDLFQREIQQPLAVWLSKNLPRAKLPKPLTYPLWGANGASRRPQLPHSHNRRTTEWVCQAAR